MLNHNTGIKLAPLAYQSWGNPDLPALLMLHGFMGSGADWELIANALKDRFHCIAPDLPGHGASPFDSAKFPNFECYAQTVIVLLDALDLESVAAIGYSMGGRILLALALSVPDRFSGLVLESTSPGIAAPTQREERRRTDRQRASRLRELVPERFLMEWYGQPMFGALRECERFPPLLQRRLANNSEAMSSVLNVVGTGKQSPLWEQLGELSQDALVVYGEKDTKYRDLATRMVEHSPRIRAVPMEACSHAAHVEQPGRFSEICRAFLCNSE